MSHLDLSGVHVWERIPGTQEMRLTRTNPYVRLRGPGEAPPVFIQGGRIYSEGGPVLASNDLPAWFEDEVHKLSPAIRAEVGLPPLTGAPIAAPQAAPAVADLWTCPDCGKTVKARGQNFHALSHRRRVEAAGKV